VGPKVCGSRLLSMKPALLIPFVLSLAPATLHAQSPTGLRIPPGFEITEFAGSDLANDIYTITSDPKGRVVVAGRGYIRTLIDDDNDGKADRAVDFAQAPKDGAMGMHFEDDVLYVTGDGGLRRFTDRDRDGKADGPSKLIRAMATGGEHAAHAIRRGPDGWLYVLCGNNTGIDRTFATTRTSPIKEPTAGCVIRFSPDFKDSEIVAHGFRNAYDMDFNPEGELFTFDSDNERCVSLPWYAPTRFYHVVEGGHYGWLSPQRANFWRLPSYFVDVMPPVATLGRGSPTGCICYRHAQFPKKYRGGFFLCDWTFGQVWFVQIPRRGPVSPGSMLHMAGSSADYAALSTVFIEATGDNGFAPTGAAVHSETGDLFISVGGRGTRGGVYRVRYPKGINDTLVAETKKLQPAPRDVRFTPAVKRADLGVLSEIRRLQIEVGDIGAASARGTIWEGYTRRLSKPVSEAAAVAAVKFRDLFPHRDTRHGDARVDREILRTLALLALEAPASLLKRWEKSSNPVDDIHELAVWARCANQDRATAQVAATLLDLDAKVTANKLNRDSHWPLRVAELYAGLVEKDAQLAAALVKNPRFGRSDHALFVPKSGALRTVAARIFLTRLQKEKEFPISEGVLQLLHALPAAEVIPVVRPLWGAAGHDAGIVALLGRQPEAVDRAKFVHGLGSPQMNAFAVCLKALDALPLEKDSQEVFALIRVLQQLTEKNVELRVLVTRRLAQQTGLPANSSLSAWTGWLVKADAKLAQRLTNPDGVDVSVWSGRLERIDWSAGNPERGQVVFAKANCAACHSGNQAIGPDLKGVTKRFSRADLLTALIQPSRDVPARYQLTQVETRAGKFYEGVVIYDAVDSLILHTGAAATVRLAGEEVAVRRPVPRSLMPAGLLDTLTDTEIADLFTFLAANN